jgi:hypothetical protein
MVEQQIGDTKDVDLNLYNLENKFFLFPCKISSPITYSLIPSLLFSFWRLRSEIS